MTKIRTYAKAVPPPPVIPDGAIVLDPTDAPKCAQAFIKAHYTDENGKVTLRRYGTVVFADLPKDFWPNYTVPLPLHELTAKVFSFLTDCFTIKVNTLEPVKVTSRLVREVAFATINTIPFGKPQGWSPQMYTRACRG